MLSSPDCASGGDAVHIVVRDMLVIDQPGPARRTIKRWASFKRRGRLKPGQKRWVRFYRDTGSQLVVPRGLWRAVRQAWPDAAWSDRRLRLPPVEFGWRWQLRDYQTAAVGAVQAREGGVIVAPPGSGKTAMGLGLVAAWQQPALFLVHTLRLADQTLAMAREAFSLPPRAFGYIADGRQDLGSHFTVATIQTLARSPRLLADVAGRAGTVIVDECVVGETLLDGIPIRHRQAGDYVTAFDVQTGTFVPKPILRIFRRPAPDRLVVIGHGAYRLVCTPNHPLWTPEGWKPAASVGKGDWILVWERRKGTGPKERGVSFWARVDDCTVLEQGRDPEFAEVCPDGYVYNCEIADLHTFIANGIVTHNCHHTPAASFSRVVNALPAAFRGGLSATPDRTDGLGPMVTALLGPRVVVPRAVLRARRIILDPQVRLVETQWKPPPGAKWAVSEQARAHDPARNARVAQVVWWARRRGQRVLVLVERKDHAHRLSALLRQGGVPAQAVLGGQAPEVQDRWFADMEAGRIVVVATKLANEGLDWPRLDALVLAAAGRSPTVLEQRTGRVSRTAPGKRTATVYDLVDTAGPAYRRQVAERIRWYRQQGYAVRRIAWPPRAGGKETAHGAKTAE